MARDQVEGISSATTQLRTCGIVMPIAAVEPLYTEAHWTRVRRVIVRAIERAGLRPQVVWENPEVDTIQSRILQNLYENDVIVCDVSGLNPNVMLEVGLRLSTKKPTVIITDKQEKPPFDISVFEYLDYARDLEFNAIDAFIDRLAKKIKDVDEAYQKASYRSFVENFTFENVIPETVSVTTDEQIISRLNELSAAIGRIDTKSRLPQTATTRRVRVLDFVDRFDDDDALKAISEIVSLPHVAVNGVSKSGDQIAISVRFSYTTEDDVTSMKAAVQHIVDMNSMVPF